MAIDAPEKSIQKAILAYLSLRGFLCRRNNAGRLFVPNQNGRTRMVSAGEPGWPDIEGIDHRTNGRYFGIEVKTRTGRIQPSQEERKRQIEKAGGFYMIARSVDDVIAAGF